MIRGHVTGAKPPFPRRSRMRRALILPGFLALLWLWNAPLAAAQPTQDATLSTNLTQNSTFGAILRVPGDFSTIQSAVDAAKSGDLVLIAPGVYHEAIRVKTADLTIRGEDRNTTILDGEQKLTNGFTVQANGVVIENLTAHHYIGNGFFWTGVTGYRGSYLTAYDNGDYGIYAFNAVQGQFDHSYASGSPDSGFYIGQCHPCDALITDVTSENNALGYSGTNAGGNLVIQNSTWRNNGAGIVPNTLDSEKGPPEWGTSVVNNLVEDNGNVNAPSFPLERPFFGVGIGVPGGNLNYIARNTVRNNSDYGILVSGIIDDNFWLPSGNVVEANKVSGSGLADIALASPAEPTTASRTTRRRPPCHRCSKSATPVARRCRSTVAATSASHCGSSRASCTPPAQTTTRPTIARCPRRPRNQECQTPTRSAAQSSPSRSH